MPKAPKKKQVTMYLDADMVKKLEEEALRRRRKIGPTVIDILHDFFDGMDGGKDAVTPARN